MGLSKAKSIRYVLESFGVQIIAHFFGGWVVYEILARTLPRLPAITTALLSSSTFSPTVAVLYSGLRMGFTPKLSAKRKPLLVLLCGIGAVSAVLFIDSFILGNEIKLRREILGVPSPLVYLNLFLLIFWGPAAEETLYRAYFLEELRQHWGNVGATLISTALFVTFHGMFLGFNVGLLSIFLGSLVFSVVYIESGLVPAVSVHAYANFYLTYVVAP